MTTTIPSLPKELVDRWLELERERNSSDLDWARLSKRVLAISGDVERMVALLSALDVSPKTVHARHAMALALDAFPIDSLWLAAGWAGIRCLRRIPGGEDRDAAVAEVLEKSKARGGGRLGHWAVRSVVARFVALTPRMRDPSLPGRRRPDVLVDIVQRLVRAFPRAIELLEDDEKQMLGLDAPIGAGAAVNASSAIAKPENES